MKKEFKAESKRLMDLMIHSIYTNKEIFLRELISNASDAIDKLHYRSLTDKAISVNPDDFAITIELDKDQRTLTIKDNGIGMNHEELEKNLGTIAKSGSFDFKQANKKKDTIDIIGQFGVGFYSAFMVSSKVEVISKAYGSDEAYRWVSTGIDGYSITKTTKDAYGTDVILTIKDNDDEEDYDAYLEEHTIQSLVKKYSDYITYPIKMALTKRKPKEDNEKEFVDYQEVEVLNSLVPLWKRNKKEIKEEDYTTFYSDKFFDYEAPLTHLHIAAEGVVSYNALLYIPSKASYDYYSKDFEKGLQLYSNGVLIMEKCADLLPDYFSFVKGVVDSPDLSLNISREMLQQTRVLKTIASNIEKRIASELLEMLKNKREDYLKFWKEFGMQIKMGIYNNFGMDKEKLMDLVLFYSSKQKKFISLKEYCDTNKDEKTIYYACGNTNEQILLLPQVEAAMEKGKEVLFCTDYVDEFVLKTLRTYDEKEFKNVCSSESDFDTEEEKKSLDALNERSKEMLEEIKKAIEVKDVRFTNKLKNHPVCLTSLGDVSVEMEKVINAMPTNEMIQAEKVLEINEHHPIKKKLEELYKKDKKTLAKYSKILYAQARLIEGLPVDNPTEITNLICEFMAK